MVGKEGKEGKEGKDGKERKEGKEGKEAKEGKEGKEGMEGKEGKEGKEGNEKEIPSGWKEKGGIMSKRQRGIAGDQVEGETIFSNFFLQVPFYWIYCCSLDYR
jgi:hypothetical protein